MIVILMGVESVDHRRTLMSLRTESKLAVGISYRSLKSRRLGAQYVRDTADGMSVMLEGGAARASLDRSSARKMQDDYYEFLAGIPEIVYAIQFEHPSLERDDLYLPDDPRVVPVLADPTDTVVLSYLLAEYGQAAMVHADDKRIPPILRRNHQAMTVALASGLGEAHLAGFQAVTNHGWTVPGRYGDPIVWDGSTAVRHKKKNKPEVLKAQRHWLEEQEFAFDLLESDDSREWNRVAARSLLVWAEHLAVRVPAVGSEVSGTNDAAIDAETVNSESASATSPVIAERRSRARIHLPVMGRVQIDALGEGPDGVPTISSTEVLRSTTATLRQCDTCFLAGSCPAYEAGSNCAFEFPVEVRTDVQVKAMLATMVEIQVARVAFARFAEEINGGYPDPVVGDEMDRLVTMTDKIRRFDERRERLTVSVEAESSGLGAAGGVLSSIFGPRAAPPAPPIQVLQQVSDTDVVEG